MSGLLLTEEERFAIAEAAADADDDCLPTRAETLRSLLARHDAGGWIPVSERLPDRNVNVLIYISTTTANTYIASLDEGGEWFSNAPAADAYFLGEDGAPTHWMHLPAPPEGTT